MTKRIETGVTRKVVCVESAFGISPHMKKRRIAKAAFLNPCIFLGLLVFFAAVLLALLAVANPQALIGGKNEAKPIAVDYADGQYVPLPTPTPTCTSGPWVATQAMALDLYAAAGASDGTYSYHFGGFTFSQSLTVAVVNRYNPATNFWASMAPMPQAAIMATAVYYPTTNKIYVFGGSDGSTGSAYNITRIYDIASNTWTTGANMPNVHTFAAGGYIPATGKIHIISGYNSGSSVNTAQPNTWQYDPVANSWTDLTMSAPFPHPAGGSAYGVINNKLYIAGGRDAGNNIVNLAWVYDPVTNSYTQLADEPSTFQNNVPGSAAASGLLWVFGGGNPFTSDGIFNAASGIRGPTQPATSSSGRFFNPVTNTWTSSPNLNTSRSFPSGAAIGGNLIIAAGGYNGSTSTASAETEHVCGVAPTPTPTVTASPTPTRTPTATASPTPTPTPTPCTGRCSPTPRPCPTSAGRPTPPPRLTPPPSASPSVTPAPRPTPPPRLTPPPTPTGSPRPTPPPRP